MRVEFLAENIEKIIPILSKILPSHSQIPVLTNILLVADKQGLLLTTTNLELGAQCRVLAKIEEEGAVTVPGKQFLEALSSIQKGKVTLFLEKDTLHLISQGSTMSFQTITKEEFPNLFEEKGEEISVFLGKEINDIFSKLVFAAAVEESRPELTGILLSQKEDKIDFVATDGFRLSLKEKTGKTKIGVGENIIISTRLINELLAFKNDELIKMYVYKKGNQVLFETPTVLLVGRLIHGEFPNYQRVIPKNYKTKIVLDREEMLKKVKLSSIFARESANIVKIEIKSGVLSVFSKSSSVGEGEASLEVDQEGDDNDIAFNIKFLSDFLRSVDSQEVVMEMNSSLEPALFKTKEDPDFVHIIMPVRVQE